jgi:hypothetical protein
LKYPFVSAQLPVHDRTSVPSNKDSFQKRKKVDLEKLRIDNKRLGGETKGTPPPRHKPGEKFLRGPIPWSWLAAAGALPGKCLHVAVAMWFEVGLRRGETGTIKLSPKRLRELGSGRYSTYRALAVMEKARLIAVHKTSGRAPIVDILDPADRQSADLDKPEVAK